MAPHTGNRFRALAPLVILATVLAISCVSDTSGPNFQPGYLALAPSFESSAAGIVDVDSVHVVLTRQSNGEIALDTVVSLDTDSETVDLSFSVPIESSGEVFRLTLECLSPTGEIVFSAGPLEVTATTTSGTVEAQDVEIEYVGVGSDAVSVEIMSDLTYLDMGDTYVFEAQALDDSGEPIVGTPIKWISETESRLIVLDAGVGSVQAGLERGWVHLIAELLTGPADTIDLYVEPVPSEIVLVSGSGQAGLTDGPLPDPIVVQVNAPDGPMSDASVDFTTTGSGSFNPATVLSDTDGHASTVWTLGPTTGSQTGTATATNWPTIDVTFSATAVTPQTPRLSFTVQPSDITPGATITPAVQVSALNEFGEVDVDYTDDITIAIANNPGNGTLAGTTTVSPTLGVAAFTDLSIDLAGAGYTLTASAPQILPATSAPFNVGSFQAMTVNWANAGGGNWNDPANWDAGRVPSATDTVHIALNGDYNVTLDRSATVQILRVGGTSGLQAFSIDTTTLTVTELAIFGPTSELLMNNEITGNGGIGIQGRMLWTLGTISTSGGFGISTSGHLEINSSNYVTLNGPDLQNDGTVDWIAGGLSLEDGNIENTVGGIFNAYADASISAYGSVNNYGYFQKEGADSTRILVPFNNYDTGVLAIGSGWLLVSDDFMHADQAVLEGVGTLDFTSATVQSLEGYIRPGDPGETTGILTIDGNIALGASASIELDINGPTQFTDYDALDVTGSITLGGTLTINSSYTPTAGQQFRVLFFEAQSGDFASVTGLTMGGGFTLDQQWSDTFLDLVALEPAAAGIISWTGAAGGTPRWEDPANWDLGRVPNPLDTVKIDSLGVEIYQDATVAYMNIGTDSTTAGVQFFGTLQIDSSVVVAQGSFLGGTANSGITGAGDITVQGELHCSQACVLGGSGNTTVEGGATLDLQRSVIDGRTIQNYGTIRWTGINQDITMSNGAQITNNGLFNMFATAPISAGAGGTPSIINNGTAVKDVGTGNITVDIPFTNNGTLDVQTGTLAFTDAFVHANNAVLQGVGTFDFSTTSILGFEGDVIPGGVGATGILDFIGNAFMGTQSTSSVEIGGLTPGTEYDQATLTGDFAANGTLAIDVVNGFTPQLGQTFTILTYASRSGEFSDTTGISINASLEFQLNWGATSLELEVVDAPAVIPTDIVFFGDSGFGADMGVFTGASDGSAVAKISEVGTPVSYLINPRWSQDKQRIAFTTDDMGTSDLYMMTNDGTTGAGLVNNVNAGYPRWNSNGQHLGFICRITGPAVLDHICVIPNVAGPIAGIPENTYTVVSSGMPAAWQNGPAAAAWNPSAASPNQIFFARDSTGIATVSKFFSVNYDGTGLDTITTDVMQGVAGYLRVIEMDVSPDGLQIVFVGEDTETNDESLWVINRDGTGLTRITAHASNFYDERPVFSPDGTEVLFGRRDDFCELSYMVVNADGTGERELAHNALSCESDPNNLWGMDWSPDGSQIVLVGLDPSWSLRVYVVPSDVTSLTYDQVRVPVGRDTDSGLIEGQPNWRP